MIFEKYSRLLNIVGKGGEEKGRDGFKKKRLHGRGGEMIIKEKE